MVQGKKRRLSETGKPMEQVTGNAAIGPSVLQGEQYLGLALGGRLFGIPLASVREVIRYVVPTPVPMMPDWVAGVINLRGTVVPVLDLASRLGLMATLASARTCIVLIETGRHGEADLTGILVDAVGKVYDILPEQIEIPDPSATPVAPQFLLGFGRGGGNGLLLLNLQQVMPSAETSAQMR